jgi:hypothetical protein
LLDGSFAIPTSSSSLGWQEVSSGRGQVQYWSDPQSTDI